MTHIAFIDANLTAFDAMARAIDLGYRVSFLERSRNKLTVYQPTDEREAVLSSLAMHMTLPENPTDADFEDSFAAVNDFLKVDAVICMMDSSIVQCAHLAKLYGLCFISPNTAELTRDKAAVRAKVGAAGLNNANFMYARSADDVRDFASQYRYPVIVKPVGGRDSYLTFKVDTFNDVDASWKQIEDEILSLPSEEQKQIGKSYIVEEYLSGPMVSVEILVSRGSSEVLMITQRNRSSTFELREYSVTMPADLSAKHWHECAMYSQKLISALNLNTGIFHIELIITQDRGPILVEINPRLMGGYMPLLYRNLTDIDVYALLFEVHLGKFKTTERTHLLGRYASSVRLECIEDGIIKDDRFPNILDAYTDQIVFTQFFAPIAGRSVSAGETLGRFQIIGKTSEKLQSSIHGILSSIEAMSGLKLLY